MFVIIMVSGSSLCYLSDFLYLYEGLFIESLFIIAIVLKTISCILYFTVSHRKNPYPVVALGLINLPLKIWEYVNMRVKTIFYPFEHCSPNQDIIPWCVIWCIYQGSFRKSSYINKCVFCLFYWLKILGNTNKRLPLLFMKMLSFY